MIYAGTLWTDGSTLFPKQSVHLLTATLGLKPFEMMFMDRPVNQSIERANDQVIGVCVKLFGRSDDVFFSLRSKLSAVELLLSIFLPPFLITRMLTCHRNPKKDGRLMGGEDAGGETFVTYEVQV